MTAHRRRQGFLPFEEAVADPIVGVPAGLDQVHPAALPPSVEAVPACRALESDVHRERMCLGVPGEPAQEQGHDIAFADAQLLAPAATHGVPLPRWWIEHGA